MSLPLFFFNDTATTEIYTLSLHDALPIYGCHFVPDRLAFPGMFLPILLRGSFSSDIARIADSGSNVRVITDRKSTRLNSSHQIISYAVFCLKKKKKIHMTVSQRYSTHTED